MMVFAFTAFLLAAAPAPAAQWRASERLSLGGGRTLTQDLEMGALMPSGRWDFSTRIKSFRFMDAFSGTETEFSARLERRLPHVTIAGRLGTAPPNAQRAAEHIAGGEVLLTFYGLRLGPQDLATAAGVAEDTPTAAGFSGLKTDWVTRFRVVYTNTNHHHEPTSKTGALFYVVQNGWQFEISETWHETTTLLLRGGGDRYSRVLRRGDPAWYLLNTDYGDNPLAVRGWPNNHIGADLVQKFGDWAVKAGMTRLNMISGDLEVLLGGGAFWRPRGGPVELGLGWHRRHRRHFETREAWGVSAAYRW